MVIVKRDGSVVDFDRKKIEVAISKANAELPEANRISDEKICEIAVAVEARCAGEESVTVEMVQDWVENLLIGCGEAELAKCYIRYRYLHKMARSQYDELMSAVAEKLSGSNIENQNANVDEHSFGGRIGEATRIVTKKFALDYCMSEMSRKNHLNNEIYIHDLDSYAVGEGNCLSIPFDKLLASGFNTRQTDVRPANSVNTAFQLVAVIFQLQSLQQFGGVSATHLDWTMVPYVRKSFYKHYRDGLKYLVNEDAMFDFILNDPSIYSIDDTKYAFDNEKAYRYAIDMTEKEIKQAVEGMYHNLK